MTLPLPRPQEGMHAVALGAELLDAAKYAPWLARMVAAQVAQGGRQAGTGAGGWGRAFFDDMNWAVLALAAAHAATDDGAYLAAAEGVFRNVSAGWDTSACGGGVWWNTGRSQKATASNAGPALAAALLHGRTGRPAYRAWCV